MCGCVLLLVVGLPVTAGAQEIRLAVPQAVADSGLMDYMLPRFTLKHRVKVRQVAGDAQAEATIGTGQGTPVFEGLGETWTLTHDGSDGAATFADWLLSDVGRNTVAAFDGADFTSAFEAAEDVAVIRFDGDAGAGRTLSFAHCGRCHVIDRTNRMKGMGATPSFAMLRTLEDWQARFAGFYRRNPHPSFTQVAGVTPPFDQSRPSPIVPLLLTPADIDAIGAFVATIPPADLGAPIQTQ